MATSSEMATSTGGVPAVDLLRLIGQARILPERRYQEVRERVQRGDLPSPDQALARALVREGVLTAYQADRLLKNKPQSLCVGKYVILDRIGSGAMGRVFQAHHLLMGRVVALKVIAPEIASKPKILARFQREMKLVGRLDHPNVVRAYDADQVGRSLYIVMEYVGGESLGACYRRQGPLPVRQVIDIAAQAARGLDHAHRQGVVHRDIKPTNLLLGDDGRVRVLDLGLGVLMEADEQATFATADGIAVGTVDYMSPEQASGRDVDGRSDLFSLGCLMYQVISGQHAFPGRSPLEKLALRLSQRPQPLNDLVDLPPGLAPVLDRLLAPRPADRYATAEEAAEALESVLESGGRRRPRLQAAVGTGSATLAAVDRDEEPDLDPDDDLDDLDDRPGWPAWFRPLARLVERSAGAALLLLLSLASLLFGLGFLAGRLGR